MQLGLTNLAKMQRVSRYPKHTWNIKALPFQITPVCIAPVLAGDTLKSALYQHRTMTENLSNQLIGWWTEHMWFYVPLRCLPNWATFEGVLLENSSIAAAAVAANVDTYHCDATAPDYVKECLQVVVEAFFRDEGQAWNASGTVLNTDQPLASARMSAPGWMDSVALQSDIFTGDPGMPEDAGTDTMEELDRRRLQWEFLRANNLIDMEYPDYLKQFGVTLPKAILNQPEQLRHTRQWQLPSSAVDGATGAVATVVSWAGQERMDKDRRFTQPGFIFGISVTRPKVYFHNVKGAGVDLLTDALVWLPRMLQHEAAISLKEKAAGVGPLDDSTAIYITDVRDLFLHGDQFINYALDGVTDNGVALPNDALTNLWYPSATDIDNLFVAANTTNLVRQDGMASFTIASTISDVSPSQAVL